MSERKKRIYVATKDKYGIWYYNEYHGWFCGGKRDATVYATKEGADAVVARVKQRSGTETFLVGV